MTTTTETLSPRMDARVVIAERMADMQTYISQLAVSYGWESDEYLEAKRSLARIREMLYDDKGELVQGVTSAHKEDDLNIILGYHGMTVGIIGHRKQTRCTQDCGYYTYHARIDRWTGERIEPSVYHFGLKTDNVLPEGHVHTWERDPEDPQPVEWSAHS